MSVSQLQLMLNNRQPHMDAAFAPVRWSTLEAAVAEFSALMERLGLAEGKVCTCCQEPAFEVNTDRADAGPYRAMEMAAVDRMLFGQDGRGVL